MAREGGGKGPSLFPAPPTRDSVARGSANSTLQLHGPGDGRGPAHGGAPSEKRSL